MTVSRLYKSFGRLGGGLGQAAGAGGRRLLQNGTDARRPVVTPIYNGGILHKPCQTLTDALSSRMVVKPHSASATHSCLGRCDAPGCSCCLFMRSISTSRLRSLCCAGLTTGARAVNLNGITGSGIKVGIVDTGAGPQLSCPFTPSTCPLRSSCCSARPPQLLHHLLIS